MKNIIQKGLQEASDDNLNDSIRHGNIMTTDEDVLFEDEAHLQTHHVTTNVKRGEQEENMRNTANGGKL